jgi:hypothetical protein
VFVSILTTQKRAGSSFYRYGAKRATFGELQIDGMITSNNILLYLMQSNFVLEALRIIPIKFVVRCLLKPMLRHKRLTAQLEISCEKSRFKYSNRQPLSDSKGLYYWFLQLTFFYELATFPKEKFCLRIETVTARFFLDVQLIHMM